MRIGIMGGTFDPIHMAHLVLGEQAFCQFQLDRVLFLPAGFPPHKIHREGRATNAERLEMTRLAIEDNPHFELCDLEMKEDRLSYSYETLEELRTRHPDWELFFIIGADSLRDFKTWKMPQRICNAASLIVAVRGGIDEGLLDQEIREVRDLFGARVFRMETFSLEISSTHLRKMVRCGESIRYYVPEAVRHYIDRNHLYQNVSSEDSPQEPRHLPETECGKDGAQK